MIILISLLGVTYLSQLQIPNTLNVWISNGRCLGLDNFNRTSVYAFAPILTRDSETTYFGNGLLKQVNVNNVTFLSVSEGIAIWANDSLNAYQFPVIFDMDNSFIDTLYLEVTNLQTTATVEGISPLTVPTFNIHGAIADQKAYAYADLNAVETSLNIKGNMTYTLSVSADISIDVSLPSFLGLSSYPTKISGQQSMFFGSIEIECINGIRQNAYINFPYKEFAFSIKTPYLHTIF